MFTSEVVAIEERGDLPPHGAWTTLAELAAAPHRTVHVDHGRGVHSLRREPRFAIGHRSFVVQTRHGNLLWDAPRYIDEGIVGLVRDLGGVTAIAASHPHMFGAQLNWSEEFGGAPVYVPSMRRCHLRWCAASSTGWSRSTTTGSTPSVATRSTAMPRR